MARVILSKGGLNTVVEDKMHRPHRTVGLGSVADAEVFLDSCLAGQPWAALARAKRCDAAANFGFCDFIGEKADFNGLVQAAGF